MTSVTYKPFGTTRDGKQAMIYEMINKQGSKVLVTDYGATIVSIKVPDKNGDFDDIVLGYDNIEDYMKRTNFYGATIGRCCNRIGKAQFIINGKTINVFKNDGSNHLHGGNVGFDSVLWETKIRKDDKGEYLAFYHISPDGDENYPGNLDVNVTMTWSDDNTLAIHYYAVSDKDTVCNLTNHTYFNLAGQASGDILSTEVKIYADKFTPSDSESIPTGEIKDVAGTPMDFRDFHTVGERINDDFVQLKNAGGYDHNWVLNKSEEKLKPCAEFYDKKSGRHMTCLTTLPCTQFYTGNYILPDQPRGKGGVRYIKRAGMAVETQFAPDAINKKNFTSTLLKAGEKYDQTTVYRFDIK